MSRMKHIVAAFFIFTTPALAQNVQQSGSVTRNHIPLWLGSGALGDGGSSASSPITSIGITNNGANGFCINSASITASSGYNQLCLGAQTTGPASISLQNFGAAVAQSLQFSINGTVSFTAGSGGIVIDGTAPTSCTSTGSGSGATCAFSAGSNNSIGNAIITAGTSASASGTVTINFSSALGSNTPVCEFGYDDTGTAWNTGALPPHISTISTTTVSSTWNNNAVGLTSASTYRIMYQCFGK